MSGGGEFETRRGDIVLGLARRAIEGELGLECEPQHDFQPDWVDEPAATFVTLTLGGQLRGCIGSLSAKKPLREDVAGNARAAAFRDPRFPPLGLDELEGLGVEVSVLTPPEPIDCSSQDELLIALRPGVDGLVLECGPHRATFLPQVWENRLEPLLFVEALKRKAGLASDFWSDDIRFSRYTVEKYSEAE
jgi:AmmeMemoRadiSam system protein A